MLSKLTRGNQITTIHKAIVERTGLKECIFKEDWKKFKKKMLINENSDISLSAKDAEYFLEKRGKKK